MGTTQPSFDVAAETLGRLIRLGISKSTVWRHHKEVTEQVEIELEREEKTVPALVLWSDREAMAWIDTQDPVLNHASVSIDGVKILLRGEGYKEVKVVSVSEVELEPEKESRPQGGEEVKERQKKTPDTPTDERGRQDGLKLTRHSYRAVLGEKASFAPALKTEMARRGVNRVDKITTVNDGADWIWDLVHHYLPERRVEVLDWSHAVQNLNKASHAAWGEGSAQSRAWLDQRKTELWNGQIAAMRTALVKLPQRYKERGKHIRQVRGYMAKHTRRLSYDRFREEGRPIGSGTVESAAKNVVAWRMKRGGQRWGPAGATRMLAALGETHSNRWDAWGFRHQLWVPGRRQVAFTRARGRRPNSTPQRLAAA